MQEVIFEEYARAQAPGRLGHIGEGLVDPRSSPSVPRSSAMVLPKIASAVKSSGVKVARSPAPAVTLRH